MLTIILPFPPAGLFPNRANGKHWTVTRKLRDGYRNDCHVLTRQAIRGWEAPDGDIPLVITFIAPDRRHRDRDNTLAAFKNGADGMALAMGVDDARFEPITIRREYGSKPGAVRVEVAA